jgi:tRNA(Ile)-lysidine synthase
VSPELLERVRAEGLLVEARSVVVMLSGGRDSTCLLDLAAQISGTGFVSAVHLNYRLRAAADGDEAHCVELCASLGVPLDVRRPSRPHNGGNLQAWARQERYAAAAAVAEARGADIAAGHTATDQVETILYRLASSPSRRALLGMRPREGRLVRPLLRFTREQTTSYCRERGLSWREDETNESDRYARGRVRARLLPALEAVHPAAAQNVLAAAEILRDEAAVLDQLVSDALGGRREIELARLRSMPAALARLIVQRLADDAAGHPAPGTARRAEEVMALRDDGALDLPHGIRAVASRGTLRFECHTTGGRKPALKT